MRCRVTGTKIRKRDREDNVKGLHVAHIFPLGYVPMVSSAAFFLKKNVYHLLPFNPFVDEK
jgi:hypothetical protein